MALIYDLDIWHWYMALIYSLDIWPWDMTLIYSLDILPWYMTLIYSLDIWPWYMTLIYSLDIWPWYMTMIYSLDIWPWYMTLIYGIDIWLQCHWYINMDGVKLCSCNFSNLHFSQSARYQQCNLNTNNVILIPTTPVTHSTSETSSGGRTIFALIILSCQCQEGLAVYCWLLWCFGLIFGICNLVQCSVHH